MWDKCPPQPVFILVDHDEVPIETIVKTALKENPKYELYDEEERKFNPDRSRKLGDDRYYQVLMKKKGPWADLTKRFAEVLGYPGRMVCGSKSLYSDRNPANITIFNSNVCTKEDGKLWYGDIDVTIDAEKLLDLAATIGKTVYVLYEMDGRFENEDAPLIEKAAFSFSPDDEIIPGERMVEYVQVCKQGKLAGQWVYKKEYRR